MSSLPETQRSRGNLVLPSSSFQNRRFPLHSKKWYFRSQFWGKRGYLLFQAQSWERERTCHWRPMVGPRCAASMKKRCHNPKRYDQQSSTVQTALSGNRTTGAGQFRMCERCLKGASQDLYCHQRERTGNIPTRAPESYWEKKKTQTMVEICNLRRLQ